MSLVVWDPARDRRFEIFYQVAIFCWDYGYNLQLWSLLTVHDHFHLQAASYSCHICCVDIVIFLTESDTESEQLSIQDVDG